MFSQGEIRTFAESAEVKRIHATAGNLLKAGECNVIEVTSARRGEGKTLAAISLGIADVLDNRKHKVLLMDLNWQDPAVHQVFGKTLYEDEQDFGTKNLRDLVLKTTISGLDLFIPDKAVLRRSFDFENPLAFATEMIRQARSYYDLIVADTRSLFPENRGIRIDPVKVCPESDAVLVVALAAVTARQEIKKALMMLETAGARGLCVVLNQWKNPIQ